MPIQHALDYIRHVRSHESAQEEIRALESDTNIESLTRLGLERGFVFTADEFRRAHVIDWEMRARIHSPGTS